MKYAVKTFRDAGLEAKWSRTRSNAPIIVARKNSISKWFYVDQNMYNRMLKVGILEGFEQCTLLGDLFFI